MFKTIIKGKKPNFLNNNFFSKSNNTQIQSLKLFNISEYSFTRKQINKQDLIDEMNNIISTKKQIESSFQTKEELISIKKNTKRKVFTRLHSRFYIFNRKQ